MTKMDDENVTRQMTYDRARKIIWVPDEHDLEEVAEAALVVLEQREQRGTQSADAHQASYLLHNDTRLNRVRSIFSAECGRIEQAAQQRRPLSPVELRRMEFEAVRRIAAELGVKI